MKRALWREKPSQRRVNLCNIWELLDYEREGEQRAHLLASPSATSETMSTMLEEASHLDAGKIIHEKLVLMLFVEEI